MQSAPTVSFADTFPLGARVHKKCHEGISLTAYLTEEYLHPQGRPNLPLSYLFPQTTCRAISGVFFIRLKGINYISYVLAAAAGTNKIPCRFQIFRFSNNKNTSCRLSIPAPACFLPFVFSRIPHYMGNLQSESGIWTGFSQIPVLSSKKVKSSRGKFFSPIRAPGARQLR